MSDRNIILSTPGVMSSVRQAMHRSPSHAVDQRIPARIGDLLDRLDEAEARHEAQVAPFHARHL